MNEQALAQFYGNQVMRDSVQEFLILQLRDLAAERTFDGKDVTGIQEAKEVVDNTFIKLKELFEKVKEPQTDNEAR